jgi:predicted nucleic acid-binding protein
VPQISRDPDDDYLFALAGVTDSRAVVSGDLDPTDLEGPPIPVMTPATAVEALL